MTSDDWANARADELIRADHREPEQWPVERARLVAALGEAQKRQLWDMDDAALEERAQFLAAIVTDEPRDEEWAEGVALKFLAHATERGRTEERKRLSNRLCNPSEAMVEAVKGALFDYDEADHDDTPEGYAAHVCRAIAAHLDEKEKADG